MVPLFSPDHKQREFCFPLLLTAPKGIRSPAPNSNASSISGDIIITNVQAHFFLSTEPSSIIKEELCISPQGMLQSYLK